MSLLLAVILILFGAISLAAPSAMMSLAGTLGMEDLRAYYSIAVYERTGGTGDLATAVEYSYDVGHYSDAAQYGAALLEAEDFAAYCEARDEDTQGISAVRGSYAQYAGGIVASAQYYGGETELAVETAAKILGQSFPRNNAFIYLTAAAMESDDVAFCKVILSALDGMELGNAQEQEELEAFIADLRAYCAE